MIDMGVKSFPCMSFWPRSFTKNIFSYIAALPLAVYTDRHERKIMTAHVFLAETMYKKYLLLHCSTTDAYADRHERKITPAHMFLVDIIAKNNF